MEIFYFLYEYVHLEFFFIMKQTPNICLHNIISIWFILSFTE